MSCGCNEPYSNVCRQDIPYPQVSKESVPSLIDNLVTALYGDITKSVVNGKIVWNIPCDPNNTAEVPGIPRLPGEGLLCYLIRCFDNFNAKYIGAFASAPSGPQVEGALYWNSTLNEIFVWNGTGWQPVVPGSFNQFTPWESTGSTYVRNIVDRSVDIFNVKDFGAIGDGQADDTASIQAAIDAAPAAGVIYFPKGTYRMANIPISKTLSVYGDGFESSILSLRNSTDAVFFNINKQISFSFFIKDIALIDPHGARELPSTGVHWTVGIYQEPTLGGGNYPAMNNLTVDSVLFKDIYDGIFVNAKNLIVRNCKFLNTYGKASLGAYPIEATHPNCGILGLFFNIDVHDNYYDGLVNDSFSGVTNPNPYIKRGTDGFIYSQVQLAHDWVYNAFANEICHQNIYNNVVINHQVEGIQCIFVDSGTTRFVEKNKYFLNVSNNTCVAQRRFLGTYLMNGTNPCIQIAGDIKPNIVVTENEVGPSRFGIRVSLEPDTNQDHGQIQITNNVINQCVYGIQLDVAADTDIISGNTISCASEPTKYFWADGANLIEFNPWYTELIGINFSNGNPIITDNTINAVYDYDQVKIVIGQASNVLSLNNTYGMSIPPSAPPPAVTILFNNRAYQFPITAIVGNTITLDSGYFFAFGSPTFTNGTSVKFAFRWHGIISSAMRYIGNDPGPSTADQISNNKISGFERDFSTWNSVAGTLLQVGNTSAKDVYEKSATYNTTVSSQGFYYTL